MDSVDITTRRGPEARAPLVLDCRSRSREPVSSAGAATKQFSSRTKPFSRLGEDVLKLRSDPLNQRDEATELGHVGVHPQLNLPRNSQDLPVRNAQVRSRLKYLQAPKPAASAAVAAVINLGKHMILL